MRKDYARLIIDCTRNPNDWDINKDCRRNRLPVEDLPIREPMKMKADKGFNDRLSPLYGLLRKNCGRYWDDVWSEICTQADIRNVAGWHLRQHIETMVSTKIVYNEKGEPTGPAPRRWYKDIREFYVDEHGILRETHPGPPVVANRRQHPQLKPGKGVSKINGCWFEGEWVERSVLTVAIFNKIHLPKYVFRPDRQLNRKELKRLGLKNDNQE